MQRRWWRLAWCLAALSMASTAAMAAQPAHAPRVIGYVLDRDAPLPPVDAGRLDTVIYSFAVVDAAHRVQLPRAGMGERLSQLARARDEAGRPQVLLAIGGWGAGHFSEAAASEAPSTPRVDVDPASADGRAVLRGMGLSGPDQDIIVLATPEMAGNGRSQNISPETRPPAPSTD